MRLQLITLFPEFFTGPLATGLVGKAIAAGRVQVQTVDPRSFTSDRHHKVDDPPCGGGGGMVMRPGPVVAALRSLPDPGRVLLMSPQGRRIEQADLRRLAAEPTLTLISGRYEGYDERIRGFVDEELSLGDFVLTGGEYAALAIVDGVVRLLPGTLGNPRSSAEDSFSAGLLEHPQYTRPLDFEGAEVPELLSSGHHERVAEWRHAQALLRTWRRRPELLAKRGLSVDEAELLYAQTPAPALCAVYRAGPPQPGEVEVWAALAATYSLGRVFIWGPAAEDWEAAIAAAPPLVYPCRARPPKRRKGRRPPPRSASVRPAERLAVIPGPEALPDRWADRPVRRWTTRRRPPAEAQLCDPAEAFGPDRPVPCLILAPAAAQPAGSLAWLPPLRGGVADNRLPAPLVAALILDRMRGEA